MTKKDFKLIAETIQSLGLSKYKGKARVNCRSEIACHFANELKFRSGNPRFDRTKFINACINREEVEKAYPR